MRATFWPRGPPNPDYQIQVRIKVSLGYAGSLGAEPITAALLKLAAATKSVIDLFDVNGGYKPPRTKSHLWPKGRGKRGTLK